MAAPRHFDPLVDLEGVWTTQLAEMYLPIEGMPPAKYECVDGSLYVSPRESSANVFAASALIQILDPPARLAGYRVTGSLNLKFTTKRWIEPDVSVLGDDPVDLIWVPSRMFVMPVEFVSPSSRRVDMVDKPRLCADDGIPYFMRVEVARRIRHARVVLSKLDVRNRVYGVIAEATAGETFVMTEPFAVEFDPVRLVD